MLVKYWREIVIAILVIGMFFLASRIESLSSDKQLLINARDSAFNVAKAYVDKNGDLVHQVRTHEVTIGQLKEHGDALIGNIDRLERKVSKLERLAAHWEGQASVSDTVTVVNRDTVYVKDGSNITGKWFEWSNKFMSINGITTARTTSLTYKYSVDFSLTAFRKPQGFLGLGKSQLVTDIYFNDPNFTVQEFKGFIVSEPKRKWYETKVVQLLEAGLIGYTIGRIQE